jgi:dipeptidyl aminopeptidase/acylaminoacyl peptidase
MTRSRDGGASLLPMLVAVLLGTPGASAAAPAPDPWTIDDILLAESASDFAISPDGRAVVWAKSRMDKEEGAEVSNLMLSALDGQAAEVELTRGKDRSYAPRWSPDGQTIAFFSTRPRQDAEGDGEAEEDDGEVELWLIRARGGEAWPLTDLGRKIVGFGWKDDATIVMAAAEVAGYRDQRAEAEDDSSQVVDDPRHAPPVRLFLVGVEDGDVTRLTEDDDWIDWIEVSPDGRWVVASHQQSLNFEYDHRVPPVVRLHDIRQGTVRTLFEGERVQAASATWAPDSRGFYLVHEHSSDSRFFTATEELLRWVDAESGQASEVDLQWPRALAHGTRVLSTADGFLALLAEGVHYRPARYTRTGAGFTRRDLVGEHVQNTFDWVLGRDGATLLYEYSTATKPTQWYRSRLDDVTIGSGTAFTKLNPTFEEKPVHRAEVVRFNGARDEEVEGILYYPLDYHAGKRYPLFLAIHGGPMGQPDRDIWMQGWDYPKLLLAQRGALLLEVNYHGSSDYGLDWVESICCGDYYDLERVDLENGVDYVIERGLADPDRLGSIGWSNGAILTTELTTRTGRFKVVSAGAGDVEWISDWANVDFGASFDEYYLGAAPYQDPELYVRKSPYFRLKDVTTPTILYTGTEDRAVPPSQSWSHFRVLQQATKTPVRFILFPGEPHGLKEYQHQRRKVEEDLAWFDRHLFGIAPSDPALKEGSPLAAAVARKGFARDRGRYGRLLKGRLVPETVVHKGVRLGRFEVTRAQYAAFDPESPVPPGGENQPASGISFEQAQAYVAWLASFTGEPWRLPRQAEVEEYYQEAQADENTLDRWAGYSPSPEDAARLRAVAAGLGGAAPLLEEVGRHPGRGEGKNVYDLGGNLAEWVVGADGRGRLLGGSADQPAGATGPSARAGEAYRGFRVVVAPEASSPR